MGTSGRSGLTFDELLTLLRTSEEDQTQIARRLGVSDSAITIRVKKHLGIGVLEYRAQHGWAGRGLPPSKVRAIREAYLSGKGVVAVAEEMSTSTKKIVEIMGDQMRTAQEQRALDREPMIPSDEMDDVIKRYYAGASCVDLAKVYDCSERTVRRILDQAGVKRRTRGAEAYAALSEETRRSMRLGGYRAGSRRRSSSGFRGVMQVRGGSRWYARISANGKALTLGPYDTIEEAGRAYDVKAREIWGSDARLNFPED